MTMALKWELDGADWPNREQSHFIQTKDLNFHVQIMGQGPTLILVHGTGSSSHSWHRIMPLLANKFTVVVPDLPLHGFTGGPPIRRFAGLSGMVESLTCLCNVLNITPDFLVGHSAGAAICLEMVRTGLVPSNTPVMAFNPALTPFPGPAAKIFPRMAKTLMLNPVVPRIFSSVAAFSGTPKHFLASSTGSYPDAISLSCYGKLFANPHHTRGALAMMAHWDLVSFSDTLDEITCPVHLIHSRGDLSIPLVSVEEAVTRMPNARLEIWDRFGHLAHEEAPKRAALAIQDFVKSHT